jgi:nucleotide-binding universal stress UspA family protein
LPDEEKIMFKKILVPLDSSELAAKILPQVIELAKHVGARVTLLSVGSSNICASGEAPAAGGKEAAACPEFPIAGYLEKTAGTLRAQGLEVDWVYKQGDPAKEIVAYAAENPVDLIALASHGGGEIAWVLGSVAKKIIAHSPAPVLLMRVTEAEPPGLKSEFYYSMQTP